MTEIRLVVPRVPSTLNRWSRSFWAVRDKERKEWSDLMAPIMHVARLRRSHPAFSGPVRVDLHYALKSKRAKTDLDNRVPKHCLDAMTGWVYQDDSQVVELNQKLTRGSEADCTYIRVTPAGEE